MCPGPGLDLLLLLWHLHDRLTAGRSFRCRINVDLTCLFVVVIFLALQLEVA
jgi:hypothetical protein